MSTIVNINVIKLWTLGLESTNERCEPRALMYEDYSNVCLNFFTSVLHNVISS